MRVFLAILMLLIAAPAFAQQETPEEERSLFLSFIENTLSAPNRQISISGIEGALSSNATIGEITVADSEGVWLRIVGASIDWDRSTLLFSQRLQIERLAAERIELLRMPVADESLPSPESSSFQVPELPIAINLDELDVPLVTFGEDVFGLASQIFVRGSLALAGGSLDTVLDVTRLDGPGGQLSLAATYSNETEILDLDLGLSEPENGIVANLLEIEGRPPVELTLAGSGPLSDLDIELTLNAADERVLTGVMRLREGTEGRAFTADLEGRIARLIPVRFREFFGVETTLEAEGLVKDGGGFRLDSLQLQSAALALAASAETGADGFLTRLSLDATIEDPSDQRVILPVPGGETTLDRANIIVSYGEDVDDEWSGAIVINDLTTSEFSAERTEIILTGLAQNLDQPDARSLTFDVDGALAGIIATRADVGEALGDEISLEAEGAWSAGQAIQLARAVLSSNGLSLSLSGGIADLAFTGDIDVEAESIAPFSALAGRRLGGALDLQASGVIRPVSGAFDLTIDSSARELRIGNEVADNLLDGVTTITGRVERGEEGLEANDLLIANNQFELTADGTFATGAADFGYGLVLSDLALITDRAQGRVEASGSAVGAEGLVTLTTVATAPSGRLAGKTLTEGTIAFEGTLQDGDLEGMLGGSAFLDGVRVDLSTGISVTEGRRRLSDLSFIAGGARATGEVTQGPEGLFEGELAIDAADISTAAALLLTEAEGAVEADLALSNDGEQQNAQISASVDDFRMQDIQLAEAEIGAAIADLFGVPAIEGSLAARGLTAGGVEVAELTAQASTTGEATGFEAEAVLDNGAEAIASGVLAPQGEGFRLRLDEASLGRGPVAARLVEPATIMIEGETVALDGLVLDVGGGRVSANGTVSDTLDLSVDIAQLPLSIANLVRPDLGLGGKVDGTATISGTRDDPDARFSLQGRSISAAALRQAGLSSISVDAQGSTTGQRLRVDAAITSLDGLRASIEGSAPLGDGALALDVDLAAFPLATLNAVVPGQGLGGRLSGSARVSGTIAAPQATFDLRGADVQANALQSAGITRLDVTASGRFADNVVTLVSTSVAGPQGLTLGANGAIPISGNGLSVDLTGQAPLSLADRFLADRGTQINGTVQLDASVSGSVGDPSINGSFTVSGAQVVDPETNLRLHDININAAISGQTVTINSASAQLPTGGSITAGGTVSINASAGFPADLRVTLDEARYADGDLVVATLSGSLALTGPLARDPLLSGDVVVERAEITVPENFAGGAAMIDVIHRNPPPAVQRTLERARADDGTPTPTSRPSVVRLDIGISANNQIFVRGRGVDAELAGNLRLTGSVSDIQPVGGFEMIRGRLSILGQRITFDEGTVTLVGDFDPFLNFVARTAGSDITVIITVSGRVSDLEIDFSSQPQLPEDEVLARLIFDRGIGELSPLQIAQLAAAAAELAGGSDTSLLGSLREATGLDDLEIVTDSEGNAALRAGRYVQDNVYLGVEAGAQGSTRGTINLDITEELRARGSVGTDGESEIGIFYERDY